MLSIYAKTLVRYVSFSDLEIPRLKIELISSPRYLSEKP
jgi:hypothetical protein